jgi:hypothetical protein
MQIACRAMEERIFPKDPINPYLIVHRAAISREDSFISFNVSDLTPTGVTYSDDLLIFSSLHCLVKLRSVRFRLIIVLRSAGLIASASMNFETRLSTCKRRRQIATRD